jgi:hypothetical protein
MPNEIVSFDKDVLAPIDKDKNNIAGFVKLIDNSELFISTKEFDVVESVKLFLAFEVISIPLLSPKDIAAKEIGLPVYVPVEVLHCPFILTFPAD